MPKIDSINSYRISKQLDKNVTFQGSSKLWKTAAMASKKTDNNPALFEAFIGCVFASILRPITIWTLPGAKKEDKKYAATKAFLSGVLYLAFSAVFYFPFAKVVNKIVNEGIKKGKQAINGKKEIKKLVFPFNPNAKETEAFKFLAKYGSSFIIGAIDAFILYKLLHPAVEKVFGADKTKSKNKEVK